MKNILYILSISLVFLTLTSEQCSRAKEITISNESLEAANETKVINNDPIKFKFEGDYPADWKTVDSLNNLGLYKSALEKVKKIYALARSEKNYPQVIKAQMHKLKYNTYLSDDDYIQAIYEMDSLTAAAEFPLKQLSHLITAKIYMGYYSSNRWTIMGRTYTDDFDNKDVRTWDLRKIAETATYHYLQATSEPEKLAKVATDDFKDILANRTNGNYENLLAYRPTLLDFIGQECLSFFQTAEFGISQSDLRCTLSDPLLMGDNKAFLKANTTCDDTLANKIYAAQLFQTLTQLHLKDSSPEALVAVTIQRLKFINANAIIDLMDEHYLATLEGLINKYAAHPVVTELIYEKANWYYHHLNAESEDAQIKNAYQTAHKICSSAIDKFPDSYGAQQCRSLVSMIEAKELNLTVEAEMFPGKPHKYQVSFKNVDQIYFKLLQLPKDYKIPYIVKTTEVDQLLKDGKEVSHWTETTPNQHDFRTHSYDKILQALPKGKYCLMMADDSVFKIDNGRNVQYTFIQSTEFAMTVSAIGENKKREIEVYNRLTGEPIAGVKVQLYEYVYNKSKDENEYRKLSAYMTDQNGKVKISGKGEYSNIYPELSKGDDYFFEESGFSIYDYNYHYNTDGTMTHFFLDRKIYRPNQTIYFKGIVVKNHDGNHSVVANKSVSVTLYDVNYQKVKTLELKTNEYGSYSGEFTAPDAGLNGQMSLRDNYGSTYFSVEEYKRPKFQVNFEPVKGSYKLNTDVTVKGIAQAYAGNQIDGATVKYRVVRNAYFPYWCWYRWGYQPNSTTYEVTSGETTTDANGNFEVTFNAKEDQSVNRKFSPTYTYQILADVTDLNGETRSGQTNVSVGVNAMNLSIGIPEEQDKSEMSFFRVTTNNLNGQHLDAKVQLTISLLDAPDQVFRRQYGTVADLKLIPKNVFKEQFPQDLYEDEDQPQHFPIKKEVLSLLVDTQKSDSVNYGKKSDWIPGYYKVLATSKDEFGTEVIEEKYFTIYDSKSNKAHHNQVLWVKATKSSVEPGQKAEFIVSSKDKIRLKYKVIKGDQMVEEKIILINNEQKVLSFDVLEEDRGSFYVYFSTIRNERSYDEFRQVNVPFTNKELKLKFETFRDKMLPGSKETWKVKVTGSKGDLVAAEMVAAMYDASLDEFAANNYSLYLNYTAGKYNSYNYNTSTFGVGLSYVTVYNYKWNNYSNMPHRSYPSLDMFGFYPSYYLRSGNGYYFGYDDDYSEGVVTATGSVQQVPSPGVVNYAMADMAMEESGGAEKEKESFKVAENQKNVPTMTEKPNSDSSKDKANGEASEMDLSLIKARTNFSETAFFLPHLETNSKGEVIFSFEMPESLTEWKFLSMAHTKDLSVGYLGGKAVTQKDLMVIPNAPRFFREGDKIVLSTKISNLTEEVMSGQVQLFLTDAISGRTIDVDCKNVTAKQDFRADAKQSTSADWEIEIPFGLQALTYKIVASSGNFSDGEEMTLPVLTNRMLVTESIPLYLNKKGEKTFVLKNLVDAKDSRTLTHHKLTVEYTSNPAWYAVQALPYIMEYPYECAEQTFSRYYANAIAAHIVQEQPKIEEIFEQWKNASPDELLSNLEKNQELKSLILEETPWVLNAKSETESKKRIALLFDMHRMKKELAGALKKIKGMQTSSGGWAWFPGMKESRYISQHIICGMGHLNHLGVINSKTHFSEWQMIKNGVNYMDQQVLKDYEYLIKNYPNYKESKHISYDHLHYLYARSFFDFEIPKKVQPAYEYYLSQAKKYWHTDNIYTEAMTALLLHRLDKEGKVQDDIMKSLKELAIRDEEMGMYYKSNLVGYYWYQAPIETQAMLIEAFAEVAEDNEAVEDLKLWLLKQKQTTHWATTRATSEACYALLLRGTELLTNDEIVEVKLGDMVVEPSKTNAGTGYYKESYGAEKIVPEMGNITVSRKTDGASWGGVYWQYFEDLDKIKTHESPLAIKKELFKVMYNENGEYMKLISEDTQLEVGDKVRVRIEIQTDRDMEYVHLKDMRASGFEPVNVISQCKWQDGLWYYESTKDAATNFFMDYLKKGTYVFEYDLKVFHKGDFSNGITSMQCMYAPEFSTHSEGIRVRVK